MTDSSSVNSPDPKVPLEEKRTSIEGILGILWFVAQRLFQAIPIILAITFLSFLLMQLAPGDFLAPLRLDPTVDEAFIDAEAARLGLDKPILVQFFYWLGNVLRGDFGQSFTFRISVLDLVLSRAGATLLLAVSSTVLTWAIALPLGIFSALKQNTWVDRVLQVFSYSAQAMPSFVLAILLLFIAQYTPWFPVGGMTSVDFARLSPWQQVLDLGQHLVLPTLALSITGFAGLQRITRGAFLDVLRQDYIQTARAKGLSNTRVVTVHALRNAINPLITILGFEFASLLSGSFIAEFFFNWPGLGRLLLDSVRSFDINVVMAGLLIGSFMLILGNILADLALQLVDPRIRLNS